MSDGHPKGFARVLLDRPSAIVTHGDQGIGDPDYRRLKDESVVVLEKHWPQQVSIGVDGHPSLGQEMWLQGHAEPLVTEQSIGMGK